MRKIPKVVLNKTTIKKLKAISNMLKNLKQEWNKRWTFGGAWGDPIAEDLHSEKFQTFNECGFMGCAIGWAAIKGILPKTYKQSCSNNPYQFIDPKLAMRELELDEEIFYYLFLPGGTKDIIKYDKTYDNNLKSGSRPITVAKHIDKFLKANGML